VRAKVMGNPSSEGGGEARGAALWLLRAGAGTGGAWTGGMDTGARTREHGQGVDSTGHFESSTRVRDEHTGLNKPAT
jgi:hypothetical protein